MTMKMTKTEKEREKEGMLFIHLVIMRITAEKRRRICLSGVSNAFQLVNESTRSFERHTHKQSSVEKEKSSRSAHGVSTVL